MVLLLSVVEDATEDEADEAEVQYEVSFCWQKHATGKKHGAASPLHNMKQENRMEIYDVQCYVLRGEKEEGSAQGPPRRRRRHKHNH